MPKHPGNIATLKPAKKGEVRNPKGINGWTKLRERAQGKIGEHQDAVMEKLAELARNGDVQAAALILRPVLNVSQQEHTGDDGEPISFSWSGEAKE